ncbi:unnamed protein product, partial [Polarella glacialis]
MAENAGSQNVRGYIDGCFDIMHSGHYNAIRQARSICDVLVVGVHSDQEIAENKSMPVMKENERYALLDHIKWIDETIYDVPYSPEIATLERARADFCIHGDDMPVNAQGVCAYDGMRLAGRLRIVKRTEGVSTTDLIGRLLTLARQQPTEWNGPGTPKLGVRVSAEVALEHCSLPESCSEGAQEALLAALEMVKKLSATYGVSAVDAERLTTQIKGAVHAAASNSAAEVPTPTKCAAISSSAEGTDAEAAQKALARTKAPVQLLASTRRIREFSTARQPSPEDRVVYASGSFD